MKPCGIALRALVAMCSIGMAVLAPAVLAVACSGADTVPADARPTITVLHPDALDIFGAGWPAKFLVFLPLTVENEQGEPEGRLVRSWEHSEDYRRWTMQLRTGIRWEDGVPVTAHDVAFSLELLAHPAVLMLEPGSFRVEVIDDSTYAVELLRPTTAGTALDYFTAVYPRHLLEHLDPASFYEWEFWARPVGNGPYTVSRTLPHTVVELTARPEHYRGQPRIERVVLKLGHEFGNAFSVSALPALLSGEADAVAYVSQLDLLAIQDRADFAIYYEIGSEQPVGLVWNVRAPALADRRVRQALAFAVDREEIREALNLPDAVPVIDAPVSRRQLRRGDIPEARPYDPEQARALLDQAGWTDTDGDGMRDRGEHSLSATVLVSNWQQSDKIGLLMQSQLTKVGVRLELEELEFATLRQRVLEGDFEAAILMAGGQVAPHVLLGADSPLGYRNPEVIRLIEEIRETFDPEKTDRLNRRLAELLRADPPGVFLFNRVFSTVTRPHVRGLSSRWRTDPLWHADELWLDDTENR